jgi:hypothetical protein
MPLFCKSEVDMGVVDYRLTMPLLLAVHTLLLIALLLATLY